MHPDFQRLMTEAARLTRAGELRRATASIRAALGQGAAPAATPTAAEDDCVVIDVEARRVEPEPPMQKPVPASAPASVPGGQFIAGSHTNVNGSHEYKLFVPPVWHGQALPLVVMLHGCTQNPDDFAAGTGMNDAAREHGVFVLYPAQTQRANASRCWNWFKHNHQQRGRGEPALLAAMTRDVMARYDIDPQRVYVAGLSAGGAMAAILGDAYPDLFAAVGVHSGLPAGAATDLPSALAAMKSGANAPPKNTAVPTLVFHGDADATVHPANGERAIAARAGGVTPESTRARSDNGREYTRRRYRAEDGRVVAEHWAIHGAGHAWSGGSARGSYTDARGPDATEEMLRFFREHTLPTAR
ncbi:MAG: PHB depolymerase family esterase [Methylibium sp.]|nr:PHB depolymerase family esterase [Methylibium sp.]